MTSLGDINRVVGYGAVVLSAGSQPSDTRALDAYSNIKSPEKAAVSSEISAVDRKALLKFARETVTRFLATETTPLARGFSPEVQVREGAFVTLEKNGELRGCIGHMAEDLPLCQTVGAMAFAAAFEDRRFSQVEMSELPEIEFEISALTPLKPIAGPEQIVIGRDGVVIRKSGRSAVFLPQVALEQGWNRDEMLDNLCLKAGLAVGSWRQGAEFLTFRAIVFKETDF
jgi:AmmeMemoRadiSam system protein A